MGRHILSADGMQCRARIQAEQVLRCHKADSGTMFHMLHEATEHAVASLRILGRSAPRLNPPIAIRTGAAREIHRVPKLGCHKLGRVVIDADHSTVCSFQTCGSFVETTVRCGVLSPPVQLAPELISAHPKDVEEPAVPKGLLVKPDLIALIKVNRNSEPAQCEVGLRPPRASRSEE